MSLLCNLQNINLAYGQKIIFNNAKFAISEGDRIGLIGLNGQGKSTLFNILAGKVVPDISEPPFIFDKNNDKFNLFYIPQELDIESFPDLTIANFYLSFYPELYQVYQALEIIQIKLMDDYENQNLIHEQQKFIEKFENLGGWELENSYLSYLKTFQIESFEKSLKYLSGGEQRKIALSIGLSSRSNFILWDEPTNHLDVETIEKFEDELNNCQKTYMIISHDRYLLNHVTNKIVHIERGQINSYSGTYLDYLEYLEARDKELAKNLDKLENKHRRELAWMRQGIKARGTRSKKRVEGYENIKSEISELKSKSKKVVNLSLTHSGRKSKQLIEIKDGSFSYQEKNIFTDLNVGVFKNDKIALIGENGAGKTTLINILQNKIKLNSGVYNALDQLKIVVFDQKRESLNPDKTPFEVVGDGQDFVHFDDGRKKHVMSYLENFLFSRDQINRPIHTLSGGEKNRLQLAIFMKQSADLWIFDEPTNDLDIETIEILESELSSYKSAVIIIGHDRAFLDNVCQTTWLVHNRTIEIFEGGYSQVAPYLEALELEKSNKTPLHKEEKTQEKISTVKMNNKEKERWKVIEKEIAKQEEKINHLTEEIANFDFSSSSENLNSNYESLNKNLKNEEEILSRLYEEWEDLSEKQN